VIAMGPLEQRVMRTLRLWLCLWLRRRRLVGVVRRGAAAAGTALRRMPRPLNDTDDVSACMQVLLSALYRCLSLQQPEVAQRPSAEV